MAGEGAGAYVVLRADPVLAASAERLGGVGTFAGDAQHRLYIDFGVVWAWSALENAEALLHECGHLFRDHASRAAAKQVRDAECTAWNVGADAM